MVSIPSSTSYLRLGPLSMRTKRFGTGKVLVIVVSYLMVYQLLFRDIEKLSLHSLALVLRFGTLHIAVVVVGLVGVIKILSVIT